VALFRRYTNNLGFYPEKKLKKGQNPLFFMVKLLPSVVSHEHWCKPPVLCYGHGIATVRQCQLRIASRQAKIAAVHRV